jgi:16S rRNA (cytosine1402-N4)-methyltransferase
MHNVAAYQSDYHTSVLLRESVDALVSNTDGVYVDVTFGAGGHSRAILNKLSAKGYLYAFDQDVDAWANRPQNQNFSLISANFRYIRPYLRLEGVANVDGILADLGVSSHQFDMPERGFSYRFNAALDMRMNNSSDFTAADLIAVYEEEQLVYILSEYGELRNAKTCASTLIQSRKMTPIRTTFDLNFVLDKCCLGPKMKYYSQVYQALRMEVNEEISSLEDLLVNSAKLLKPGGRIAIITFHSIEDRLVKNFFKSGNLSGEVEKDMFGNISKPFTLLNKKVIIPDAKEQRENIRSRSAKLRVAIKN